jgi:hypothetical protein
VVASSTPRHNVSTDRRSRVPPGLGSGHPSGHVARSVAQCDAGLRMPESRKPRAARGFRVARPGLEPGTPRFSVMGPNVSDKAETPGNKRVSIRPVVSQKFAICGFCRWVWVPRSERVPKRLDGRRRRASSGGTVVIPAGFGPLPAGSGQRTRSLTRSPGRAASSHEHRGDASWIRRWKRDRAPPPLLSTLVRSRRVADRHSGARIWAKPGEHGAVFSPVPRCRPSQRPASGEPDEPGRCGLRPLHPARAIAGR